MEFIKDKRKRKIWLRAFHIWQLRPHEVAPLSDAVHECSSCSTTYQGNYCPRCGQSAVVGRFSFKNALLLFLDVWGMGNRSMFRSIRDLMFRPGYMIRDYLRGMQSAYFPPFKMFFLLAAFSLVVENGFNLGLSRISDDNKTGQTELAEQLEEVEKKEHVNATDTDQALETDAERNMYYRGAQLALWMNNLRDKYPGIFAFLALVMFSLPMYFLFRSAPSIPDLRYSEFIVALVYISNTVSIYSITGKILRFPFLELVSFLMIFVAFRELTGYSRKRVFFNIILSIFIMVIMVIALVSSYIAILYFCS